MISIPVLCLAVVLAQQEPQPLVAIADVHGDFQAFRAILRRSGLIDDKDRWAGGTRHLVQMGDLLDRGPESRKAMDLLMRLEDEAKAAGGQVTGLLGNHEVMNLTSDLRYVTRGEFAAFAREETPAMRNQFKKALFQRIQIGHPGLRSRPWAALARQITDRHLEIAFPPGFFALRQAFSPEGRYGQWLLKKKVAHIEGKTLFLHAGLSPKYGQIPIDRFNEEAAAALNEYIAILAELDTQGAMDSSLPCLFDPVSDPLSSITALLEYLVAIEKRAGGPAPELKPLFDRIEKVLASPLFDYKYGPIWYRGLALDYDQDTKVVGATKREVEAILRFHGVDRIVIGHTVTKTKNADVRYGGLVWAIDTGMNYAFYEGRPIALEIPETGAPQVIGLQDKAESKEPVGVR